jgi:hypothetical protein
MEEAEKEEVAPDGKLDTLNAFTGPGKPPLNVAVIVKVAVWPARMLCNVGDADKENDPCAGLLRPQSTLAHATA